MTDKLTELQNFLKECINNNTSHIKENEIIYSIYLKFLPDMEHDSLDFYLYISISRDKSYWYKESYGFTKVDYINVNDENEKLVELLYEDLYDPKHFAKMLLKTFKKIDYSQLNLHKKCAFKAEYSNDW